MPGQQVHQDCRRKYCNPNQVAKSIKQDLIGESRGFERPALRSDFASNQIVVIQPVRTIELKDTLLNLCRERNDSWAHV